MIELDLKILESELNDKQKELLINPFNKSVLNKMIVANESCLTNSYFIYNFLFSIHDFSNNEINEIIQFVNDFILETPLHIYHSLHFNLLFLKKGTIFKEQLFEIKNILDKKVFSSEFFFNNFYFISNKYKNIILENNFDKLIESYFENIQIFVKKDSEYIKIKINDPESLNSLDFDETLFIFDMDNLELLNKDNPLTLEEFEKLYFELLTEKFILTGEEFYYCFDNLIPKSLIKLINMNYMDNQNNYFNDILSNQKHNFYKYSTSVDYFFNIIKTESLKLTGSLDAFNTFQNNMIKYLYSNKYLKK